MTAKPDVKVYFVKSFEEDFCTKTLVGKKKVIFQTADEILKTKVIKLNTRSFGRKPRLSTTILHKNYLKTYRSQGIIFCTSQKPSYVIPFDLVLLTNADKIITHYYRIKDNLHIYYSHSLIDGYERFIFKNLEDVVKKYGSLKLVWKEVNSFRKKNGYPVLTQSKQRLIAYNEAVFEKPVKIEPVALFGRNKTGRKIAHVHGLKYYKSAKDFYLKHEK